MQTTLTSAKEWAAVEFGAVELGDRRRCPRLRQVAAALAQDPHGTLPGSFCGWSEAKAAYRLLEEPDVTYDRVIAPHRTRVRTACHQAGEFLLVEDTTSLDFTSHRAAQDLGRIGDNGGQGLYVHSTLALRVERWNREQEPEVIVEGLFDQSWWARTMPSIGRGKEKKAKRLNRPRESERWAKVCPEVGPPPELSHWTWVADREADIFETFGRCQENRWHFILRANQPRALADQGGSAFTAVAQGPERGEFYEDLRARPGQSARRARVAVRTCTVRLRAPWQPGGEREPCSVQVVEAREIDAPAGAEPIHWVLLTDWPCQSFPQALRVVQAYTRRWLIEEYHKCLKSGTDIEHSQLATAQHITALLGILAVVAIRLLHTKLLATTRPQDPIRREELEPEVLTILEKKFGRLHGGWNNQSFLVALARLGGFLARKSDGSPGWITIWRGWRKLTLLVQGYDLAKGGWKCG